jgi:hypothetical protein
MPEAPAALIRRAVGVIRWIEVRLPVRVGIPAVRTVFLVGLKPLRGAWTPACAGERQAWIACSVGGASARAADVLELRG